MPTDGVQTPLPPGVFQRLAAAARYAITGVGPDTWFGPQQPLAPQAPPDVKGRQWDYPFGVNLSYVPRSDNGISFLELRALADALPLLRAVIETRKDQIAGLNYAVRSRDPAGAPDAAARIQSTLAFLARPDRRHSFAAWLRMLLEDMLVIDAATIYPRFTRSGSLYSLDVIDGSTITPLIGEDGRSPEPPDPAYQQVLHGVPAADFSSEELLYLPRNIRSHRLYGMSPVEQIALTINIALRRDTATLDYYRTGSVPDSFATLPREWTTDQIKQFQDYFDALMSGNLARRHMLKFVPADFKLIETRQPPLKDQYDEWLARVICYAFSVPASAFVSQVNRATSETLRMQATQEGLVPLKAWVKSALDQVVQLYLKQLDLEFVWVGDDAVDPLEQAQTLQILVGAGIKTREEARADLGLAPGAGGKASGLGKYNENHDERGRFATADNAVSPGGSSKPSAPPKGAQVASLEPPATLSDGGPKAVVPITVALTSADFQDRARQLAECLQTRSGSAECLQLVTDSEKVRLSQGAQSQGPVDWLKSLGITDEATILNYLFIAPATDILGQRTLKGTPSSDIIASVQNYAGLYGIDPQLMLDVIAFETGGTFDPNSTNRHSNAAGLFQIIPGTWNELADRYRFTNPYDIDQNIHAGAINISSSIQYLQTHGVDDPTDSEVYLAHNQGAAGAAALIDNADENVVDALETLPTYGNHPGRAALAIVQNGGQTTMTAAQFIAFMTARFVATARITPRIPEN